ncbi:uncharacterized protein LOC112681175, partial [Sipha flava]|uniref:Uncharacterized protein LOC112681175 n=1 Tax=Sipha flava TaxID=143950 RepID=A0A8B8FA28_9HEMI
MNIFDAIIILFMCQLFNGQINAKNEDCKNTNDNAVQNVKKKSLITEKKLDIFYWNSCLGNDKPIKIESNNVTNIKKYWFEDLPLKIITHGWLSSDKNFNGVFDIKT